jgi:hypothetical protein
LANTPIGRRVLSTIINGVLLQPWKVLPPKEDRRKKSEWQRAEELRKALDYPNREENGDYILMMRAVLEDLLVLGCGVIERAPGKDTTQPFWLWEVNAALVSRNPEWSLENAGWQPRYYFGEPSQPSQLVPFMDSELFLIQHRRNSYEGVAPSPLEVAYDLIVSWLRLCDYQNSIASRAPRNQLISLLEADENDLETFQAYWAHDIGQHGQRPITNHKVKITQLGAHNDEEMFLKYEKKLLRCFAIAFNLTLSDLGMIEPSDDEATTGVKLNQTFREAICPYIETLNRVLTEQVISYFEPGFEFKIETAEPISERVAAKLATWLYQTRMITRNEARRRIGMPDIGPIGDRYVDGSKGV